MSKKETVLPKEKLVRIFDRQADTYEKRRKRLQFASLRKRLLAEVSGHVLEVSVGAGANFPFYPRSVKVTAVDISPKMIEKAKIAANEYGIESEFLVTDVESLDFAEDTFDTVVSTLSLCAYENPSRVLELFRKWTKPEGRILLFEHGISSFRPYAWMQNLFDKLALKTIGCHMNRDMIGMLHEVDLTIEKIETMMLGSVHLIWARPTPSQVYERNGREGIGSEKP